jgi:hypothetical protein
MAIADWQTKQNKDLAPATSRTKETHPPLPIGFLLAQNLQMTYAIYKLNADMPPDADTMAFFGRSNRDSMNIQQVPLVLFSKLFRGAVLGLDIPQDRRGSS